MLSIKLNYAAPFSLLNFLQLVPSVGDLIWPFGNVFAIFLGLRLLNISSICSRDDFNPAKCKARFVLPRPFNAVYWDPIRCFAMFLIVEVFTLIIVKTKAIECILKFFRLVVFSCLYHSWSIFHPRFKWLGGSRSSPYFDCKT